MSERPSPSRMAAGLLRSPMVPKTIAQVVNGVCAYVFLGIASRELGDVKFAPLSVEWATVFLLGTGCFLPLEQLMNRRLAGRFPNGVGAASTVRDGVRMLLVGIGLVTVVQLAAAPWAIDRMFSGQTLVYAALIVQVAAFGGLHASRGVAAGLDLTRPWCAVFVIEGIATVVFAVGVVAAGSDDAGAYTMAASIASVVAGSSVLASLWTRVRRSEPAPGEHFEPPALSPLEVGPSESLPALVVSSLLTALLINAGLLSIGLLATPAEETVASHFLTALVVARIPVFLFPAVLSIALPALASAVNADDPGAFRRGVRAIGGLVLAATVVATAAAAVAGPFVVRVAFGSEFAVLGSRDLAAMAFASITLLGALSLGQAAIALREERWLTAAWVLAVAAFVVTVSVGDDLLTRVEAGLVVSSVVALVAVGLIVAVVERRAWPRRTA